MVQNAVFLLIYFSAPNQSKMWKQFPTDHQRTPKGIRQKWICIQVRTYKSNKTTWYKSPLLKSVANSLEKQLY